MWILCQVEDSHEKSNIVLSEDQWKNIQDCRLLQSWFVQISAIFLDNQVTGALRVNKFLPLSLTINKLT